jgi:hypothetical protein
VIRRSLFTLALSLLACGPPATEPPCEADAGTDAGAPVPFDSVELLSRYGPGAEYAMSTYSFREHVTRDVERTRNSWELMFEGRDDLVDHFDTEMAVGDIGLILDLGNMSCTEFVSSTPDLKYTRPLVWLGYGTNLPEERRAMAPVVQGHCYFVLHVDPDGTVAALFHVKEHEKSTRVIIDEIETLIDTDS